MVSSNRMLLFRIFSFIPEQATPPYGQSPAIDQELNKTVAHDYKHMLKSLLRRVHAMPNNELQKRNS